MEPESPRTIRLRPGGPIYILPDLFTAAGDRRWRRVSQGLGAAALLWCGVALAGGWSAANGGWPATLGLAAAALLAVLAAWEKLPRWRWMPTAVVAVAVQAGALAALTTWLLSRAPWAAAPARGWLPPAAALDLMAASLAWLASRPRRRPVSLLREATSAGWLFRRCLAVVILFPVAASWVHAVRPLGRLTASWEGLLVFVAAAFAVFLTMFWRAADALDAVDRNRGELAAKNEEINDLYHRAPCGYHTLDPQGRFVRINDTELHWLGYEREQVLGSNFDELLTPVGRALFQHYFQQLRNSGAVPELDVELRRADGSWLPTVITATGQFSPKGDFVMARATVFDATQRKQAEAALRRSEARNRAILASAADSIVTLAEGGGIVDFNPAAENMFGMRRSVAVEMLGVDLLAPHSPLRRISLAVLAGEIEGNPPHHLEFQACRADGSVFPAELTLTRVGGQLPVLYTAFVRDLTERKRAEADLRTSEERLRLLLDSTGEGIYALDLEGRCTLCNPAAVRLLGYTGAHELLGRVIHHLVHHTHADGAPYPASQCRSYIAAREGRGIEVDDEVFWRKDGTSFPVEYHSYPIERESQVVGLVVTFTDITTRRRLEDQIRQSQKMEAIGRLAAGIAHDFNNLLTVINGYSDILLDSVRDSDAQEKLASVRAAGERAASLTHQLLAFSRQQVLQPRWLDLNQIVREMEPLLRGSVGEDIELCLRLDPEVHWVKADPSQIDQVLMNLVMNARDALPRGGRIEIATAGRSLDARLVESHPGLNAGDYVALTVRDNGTGIRPEVQSQIFEPFFTTKPLGKGTGLGLPTVFGIARQSGGTVMVESVWGRGTTMSVYLPAQPAVQGAAAPVAEGAAC